MPTCLRGQLLQKAPSASISRPLDSRSCMTSIVCVQLSSFVAYFPTARSAVTEIGQRPLDGEEHALKEDTAEFIEQLFRQTFQRRKFGDARVGHQHVDRAKTLAGLEIEPIEIGQFAHIALNRHGTVAERVCRLPKCRGIASENRNPGAVCDELARRGQPNPTVAAGNDDYFAFKPHSALPERKYLSGCA